MKPIVQFTLHRAIRTPSLVMRISVTCAALVGAGAFASVAGAAAPSVVPISYTATATLSGVCSFDVTDTEMINGSETWFTTPAGGFRVGVHQTEVDSFSANGITFAGEEYTTNGEIVIDANGTVTSNESTGEVERVVLPDGTLFLTAGRTNVNVWPPNNPGAGTFIFPEFGNQGDIAAFCGAFS